MSGGFMKQLNVPSLIAKAARAANIILAFILIFFGRKLLPRHGNFIGGIDVGEYFYWHAHFVKEQFLSGSIPLWNPYYYCGHPFVANPQTFVFYPSTLLFLILPLPWAFNIDTIGHIYLAAMGMYFFVSMIASSKSAGITAAVIYSLSGYFMDNIFAGHLTMLHTAALLPWIFYFTERAYKTGRPLLLLVSGLVFGLQILGGEPQNNYYTGMFLTVYFFMRYFHAYRPLGRRNATLFGVFFILIFAVALGISAVQVLPSLEFMSLSDRAKNTYDFATFFSFPPRNFFTFLIPKAPTLNTNWEFSGYLGILSIVLALIGVVFNRERHYTSCFALMLLLAVTIMLGRYTPVYQLYYKWLPGVSTFRIPARCLVIFVFSVAALAGFGAAQLCTVTLTMKKYLIAMAGPTILLGCLIFGAKKFHVPFASREVLLAISLTLGVFVVLTAIRFIKNAHIVAAILITAVFLDLCLTYSEQTPQLNQDCLLQKSMAEFAFERDTGFYRVNLPFDTLRGMKFHYCCINGYTPIVLDHYFHFMHQMANVPEPQQRRHTLDPALFQPNLVFSSKILNVKYALVRTGSQFRLLTAEKVMPRAVLVRKAIVLLRLEEHLRYLKQTDFDPEKQVLLEAVPRSSGPSGPEPNHVSTKADEVTIKNYCPNRIELESVSNSSTYLVLSELFYPGWHAYIDGRKVPILRADFLLRAIPLTAGHHKIIFVYRPATFLAGVAISLFTILLLAVFPFSNQICPR